MSFHILQASCDHIVIGRLLDEGMHHAGSFATSEDIETIAGSNGALLTLVNDAGSQGNIIMHKCY